MPAAALGTVWLSHATPADAFPTSPAPTTAVRPWGKVADLSNQWPGCASALLLCRLPESRLIAPAQVGSPKGPPLAPHPPPPSRPIPADRAGVPPEPHGSLSPRPPPAGPFPGEGGGPPRGLRGCPPVPPWPPEGGCTGETTARLRRGPHAVR